MEPWEYTNKVLNAVDGLLGRSDHDNVRAIVRNEDLRLEVVRSATRAIAKLSDAILWPDISREDLERALEHVHAALAAARRLDPPNDAA